MRKISSSRLQCIFHIVGSFAKAHLDRLVQVLALVAYFATISACTTTASPFSETPPPHVTVDPSTLATVTIIDTVSPTESPTIPTNPTAIIPLLPPDTVILAEDEFNISYEIFEIGEIQDEEVIVVLNSDDLYVNNEELTVDYLTWDGSRGPLLKVTHIGENSIQDFAMSLGAVPNSSQNILVVLYDFLHVTEFYIINIGSGNAWGINPGCKEPTFLDFDVLLGSEYIAFRCGEARSVWHLISVRDFSQVMSFKLPSSNEDTSLYGPRWLSEHDLILEDRFHRGMCLFTSIERGTNCWDFPYWAGNVNTDASFAEVRLGDFQFTPDELGIISVSCLSTDQVCDPKVRQNFVPSSVDFTLERAAWLPMGEGLLYTVHIDTDFTNMESDETEFWLLDIDSMTAELVGHFDLMLTFNIVLPTPSPNLWSPAGDSIVVSAGNRDHFLLSIQTGELVPFTKGGFLLGPLNLDNASHK